MTGFGNSAEGHETGSSAQRMDDQTECLLIASETSDPFSTVLINPKTGVSCWSYKGSELQGAVTGCVERIGNDSNLFIVAAKGKPLVHVLSAGNRKRLHVKSVLTKPAQYLTVTPDGTVLFAAIENQIYIWIIATGELIATVDAHYRNVTGLVASSDGSLLVSGAEDGSLRVFIVAEIMSAEGALENVSAFRDWRPHSLAVTDISITRNSNPRILSCSKDHTAAMYSVTADECLLKISCDAALTSCVIDPAECRIFLGTAEGQIAQLDLYALNKTELMVVFEAESADSLPSFSSHSTEVTRLDVNHDGFLLASGDASGKYVIWDIPSRQCLKTSTMKGPICKLKFTPRWRIAGSEEKKGSTCISTLKRQKTEKSSLFIPLHSDMSAENVSFCSDELCIKELNRIIVNYAQREVRTNVGQNSKQSDEVDAESTEDEPTPSLESVEFLKAKIAALEKANQQIYSFAASVIIDRS